VQVQCILGTCSFTRFDSEGTQAHTMAAAAGTRVPPPQPTSAPLGPATNKLNQPKKVDTALLRPGLRTTVTGMRQAIHALETGTLEVRSYLLNEVNLIYECKVCHNMFRSLVNLIAHKRSFCKQQYKKVTHIYEDPENTKAAELETVIIEAEPVETVIPPDEWEIENYAPSLGLLKDADILQDIQSRPLISRLMPPKKQGLNAVVASLRAKVNNKDARYYENQCRELTARKSVAESGTLYIEPISETSSGLFQTWKVTEGDEPTTGESYRVIQENAKAIAGTVSENGTLMPRGVPVELEAWRNGPVSPGSEGSKENHEDGENKSKFQCPECRKLFTLVKTVIKHLVRFHNKTMDEAKLLRKKIKNGAITVKNKDTPKTIELNAGVLGKMQADDVSESVLGRPKKEVALSLAMAIGLIDKNGQGRPLHFNPAVKWNMNNIKPEEGGDPVSVDGKKKQGRPKKHRDSEDEEVTFNHSPESKRAKLELDASRSKGYCSGKFKCDLADCGKSFKTPTFLLQHYVGHFKVELQEEYADAIKLSKCTVCNNSFPKPGPLIVHIGATHKKVCRYLPDDVANQFVPTTPVKNVM